MCQSIVTGSHIMFTPITSFKNPFRESCGAIRTSPRLFRQAGISVAGNRGWPRHHLPGNGLCSTARGEQIVGSDSGKLLSGTHNPNVMVAVALMEGGHIKVIRELSDWAARRTSVRCLFRSQLGMAQVRVGRQTGRDGPRYDLRRLRRVVGHQTGTGSCGTIIHGESISSITCVWPFRLSRSC
jgi:hypothetical protein